MIAPETKRLGILARWYAEPLSHEEAQALLSLSERREQERLKRNGTAYLSPLLKLIALHWLEAPTESHYHYLISKKSKSIHADVLTPLIYGQLLMSRKQVGAMDYLEKAFHRATSLLRPEDYFVLMKRHQVLKQIPLSEQASQGVSLDALIKTGSVIGRMEESHGGRPEFRHDPNDTYG